MALVGRGEEAAVWGEYVYEANVRLNDEVLLPPPAHVLSAQIVALTEAGRLADAARTGERASTDMVAANAPLPRIWALLHLARAHWIAGHMAAARRCYAEALATAREHGHTKPMRLLLSGVTATAAVLGDLRAAESAAAEAAAYPPTGYFAGEERLGDAWLLAARGQLGQARTVLADAAEQARNTGHVTSEALVLTDIARLGGAEDVLDRLAELAGNCDGALAPARAHLTAALAAADPDRLLAAATELATIGADLLAAEAATQAATAWQHAGQARKATAALQKARSCAERCQRARTPLLATTETTAALSTRETEVARLAAAGTASQDIADTLHLSVRTVENHLQNAYTKLGVTNRTELAQALDVGAPTPST
jgi:ATP/maltotriose-dependent transcriptional regulator MalT